MITSVKCRRAAAGRVGHRPRSLKTAGVEVRSSSRTSTSTRNPQPTPGHPHSTRKSRFLLVNVLGRHVGEARARIDGRDRDGVNGVGQALVVWCREREGGSDARVPQASPGAYLSRSSGAASASTLAIRLGSETRASSSIMGASASGTSSGERPAQITRPGSATRMVARARWWLPWS